MSDIDKAAPEFIRDVSLCYPSKKNPLKVTFPMKSSDHKLLVSSVALVDPAASVVADYLPLRTSGKVPLNKTFVNSTPSMLLADQASLGDDVH